MRLIAVAIAAVGFSATAAQPVRAPERTEVLIIDSDEEDGATTFKDTSPRAHPVERAGDTHHSSKQKKTGRSSIYFDGDGDYLSVADGPAFGFGFDDFAVELWLKPEGAGRRFICGQVPEDGANAGSSIAIAIEHDGRLRAMAQGTWTTHLLYAPRETHRDGEWHRISFRREGDLLRLLVDDKEYERQHIGPEPLNDSAEPFCIGRAGRFPDDPYRGFLDGFVISRWPRRAPRL